MTIVDFGTSIVTRVKSQKRGRVESCDFHEEVQIASVTSLSLLLLDKYVFKFIEIHFAIWTNTNHKCELRMSRCYFWRVGSSSEGLLLLVPINHAGKSAQ